MQQSEHLPIYKPDSPKLVDQFFAHKWAADASEQVRDFLACLLKAAREGHLCLPAPDFPLPEELFEKALSREGERIYLRRNWVCEERFLTHVKRLKTSQVEHAIPHFDSVKPLESEQIAAINRAIDHPLSLLCGGPGTGKTYTATLLIEHMLPHLNEVVVAAPTGKAAANLRRGLKELCPVQTLHALLKRPSLTADLIVVDEASMIDAEMMAKLFSAVKEGARLVLIGDPYQLPPVETGHLFADLAQDESLVTTLKRCIRAELSEIVDLAEAVKAGKSVKSELLPELEVLVEAALRRGACILTPLRHGPFGVNRLNAKIHAAHLEEGGTRFPILITTNDRTIDLYNGDVGVLVPEEKRAYFGERHIETYLLPHYEFAYVLSVHKSQGSEYDEVLVLLPEGAEVFGREMLYTAVTRAKKRVTLYGSQDIVEKVCSKQEQRLSSVTR